MVLNWWRRKLAERDPYLQLFMRNFVATTTVVARTDAVRAAGGFDETLQSAQDYKLWLDMAYDDGQYRESWFWAIWLAVEGVLVVGGIYSLMLSVFLAPVSLGTWLVADRLILTWFETVLWAGGSFMGILAGLVMVKWY